MWRRWLALACRAAIRVCLWGVAQSLSATTHAVVVANASDRLDHFRQLGPFLDEVYMHKRIHSSSGYLTPAEFADQWQAQLTAG